MKAEETSRGFDSAWIFPFSLFCWHMRAEMEAVTATSTFFERQPSSGGFQLELVDTNPTNPGKNSQGHGHGTGVREMVRGKTLREN